MASHTVTVSVSHIEMLSYKICCLIKGVRVWKSSILDLVLAYQMIERLRYFVGHLATWLHKLWAKYNMLAHLQIYGLLECCSTRCYAVVFHLGERMIKNYIGKYAEVYSICLSMCQAGRGACLLEFLMSIRVRGRVLLRFWEIRGCAVIAIFIIGKLEVVVVVAWLIM